MIQPVIRQADVLAALATIDAAIVAQGPNSGGMVTINNVVTVVGSTTVTGSVTAAISGTVPVTVTNFPTTQSVSVTNFPTTQTVTGAVTASISGTVPVSGAVTAAISGTVPVSGAVTASISGTVPISGAVTASISGTVPITGSVTASISGTVIASITGTVLGAYSDSRPASTNLTVADAASASTIGQSNANIITGTPTANSTHSVPINGEGTVRVTISGTWVGTVTFEVSNDGGTTWTGQALHVTGTGFTSASATGNGQFLGEVSGVSNFRVRHTVHSSGTVVVQTSYGSGNAAVKITNPLRLIDNSTGSSLSITNGAAAVTVANVVQVSQTSAVVSTDDTSAVYNGVGVTLTPKFAKVTASSSGATQVVAAVSSKKIRVLSISIVCNGAVNVKFQSHVTPTDISGLHYFAANGGMVMPYNKVGWFETVAGEALDINLSGAVAVGGTVTYVEV